MLDESPGLVSYDGGTPVLKPCFSWNAHAAISCQCQSLLPGVVILGLSLSICSCSFIQSRWIRSIYISMAISHGM